MKVSELIEELKKCDPEDNVISSIDSEGNGFRKVHEISLQIFNGDEIYEREITPAMGKEGFTKDDLYTGDEGVKVVCVW